MSARGGESPLPSNPAFRVAFDVRLTHRKRVHVIHDNEGNHVWASRHATEIWQWLLDQGATVVHVELSTGTLEIHLGDHVPW